MSSFLQILANRANARKSTGPKSQAGKEKARFNAAKHGLTGQLTLLPEHEFAPFHDFQADLLAYFKPDNPVETQFALQFIQNAWALHRAGVQQDCLLAAHLDKALDLVDQELRDSDKILSANIAASLAVTKEAKSMDSFTRAIQRRFKLMTAALHELQKLQIARRDRELNEMRIAVALLKLHEKQQLRLQHNLRKAYNPADDGFDFTLSRLQQHEHHRERWAEAEKALLAGG